MNLGIFLGHTDICDATETGGILPVTRTNDYNASSLEAAGCARMNQQNFPPTEWLMVAHRLQDSFEQD